MKEAIKLAERAGKSDEVPVGAIIVKDQKIISRASNARERKKDATMHAEITAIKKACKKLRDFRLVGCEMYVTLEPCMMCMGAILNARLDKLYFGAHSNKEGALSCFEMNDRAELNHKCEIEGGLMEKECSEILKIYFRSKRK